MMSVNDARDMIEHARDHIIEVWALRDDDELMMEHLLSALGELRYALLNLEEENANDSDVSATVAEAEGVRDLARAMQQRRHGGE